MPDAGCALSQGSLAFDGSNLVQVGDAPALRPASLTIELWARFTSADNNSGAATLFSKPLGAGTNDSYSIWYQNGDVNAGINQPNTDNSIKYPWGIDTNWHYAAFTYDGSTRLQSLYWNGSLVAAQIAAGDVQYDSHDVHFAMDIDNGSFQEGWVGNLSDIRLWSVVRSAAEVSSDQVTCVSGSEPDLIAAWPLADGAGSVAADIGPNHLDGVLMPLNDGGAPPSWSTATPPY